MGDNITEDRLINMTTVKTTNKMTLRAMRRRSWIRHLTKNTRKSGIEEEEKEILFNWASTNRLNTVQIAKHIASTGYRSYIP